jgi:hypothetical protein
MALYNKFHSFAAGIANGVHNLSSDQLVVALTNTAPVAENSVLADITQIAYTNLSSRNITTTSSTQTAGTYSLVLEDLVLTASGAVAEFRYAVVYNDTAIGDPLIGWYDRGEGNEITLQDGESFTIDFTEAQTLFEIA